MSDTLLEQYKLCMQLADRVLQRKQHANIFFFAANIIMLLVLIGSWLCARHVGVAANLLSSALLAAAALGTITCAAWCCLLCYYHRLSRAKYEVIRKIEAELATKPYENELQILRRGARKRPASLSEASSAGESYYRPLAAVETYAPLVFLPFYATALVWACVYFNS